MNGKRKSALILAVIATALFAIIFGLESHSLIYTAGGGSSSSSETKLSISALIGLLSAIGSTSTVSFWTPWLLLVAAVLGTALCFNKKTTAAGCGLVLGSHAVALASMTNLYATYSKNTTYKVSVSFGGILEYLIIIITIISAILFAVASSEESKSIGSQSGSAYQSSSSNQNHSYSTAQNPNGLLNQQQQEKLDFWRDLLDQNMITKEDFEKKKKEIMGR